MRSFLARLKEPSTWAGISSLAVLFGVNIQTPKAQAIATGVATLAGLAAAVLPEAAPIAVIANVIKSKTEEKSAK